MRTFILLASAALTSAAVLAGPAAADDRLHLTPPLYREQARATQQARSAADLTTTPQPVVAPSKVEKVSAASKPMIEAAAH